MLHRKDKWKENFGLTEGKKKKKGAHTHTQSPSNPTILRLKKREITNLKPEVSQGRYTHSIQ